MVLFKLYDFNTRNEAIVRMRGCGSIVPKKVSGKYIYDVEKAKAINSIEKSRDILIIYDTGSSGSANSLHIQLKLIQANSGITELKIDMRLKKGDLINGGTVGNIIFKSISETGEGDDLSVSNYGVIIICPTVSFNDGKPVFTSNYNDNFGPNLQKYINSGGNIIASSNLWVNSPPGFNFDNTPFVYKKKYVFTNEDFTNANLETITFSNNQPTIFNPILNECSSTGTGIGRQNIIKNIIPSSRARTIALSEGNIPYISALVSSNTGSRSIVINSNIFINSNTSELAKIIYNGIYWCLKISK